VKKRKFLGTRGKEDLTEAWGHRVARRGGAAKGKGENSAERKGTVVFRGLLQSTWFTKWGSQLKKKIEEAVGTLGGYLKLIKNGGKKKGEPITSMGVGRKASN